MSKQLPQKALIRWWARARCCTKRANVAHPNILKLSWMRTTIKTLSMKLTSRLCKTSLRHMVATQANRAPWDQINNHRWFNCKCNAPLCLHMLTFYLLSLGTVKCHSAVNIKSSTQCHQDIQTLPKWWYRLRQPNSCICSIQRTTSIYPLSSRTISGKLADRRPSRTILAQA